MRRAKRGHIVDGEAILANAEDGLARGCFARRTTPSRSRAASSPAAWRRRSRLRRPLEVTRDRRAGERGLEPRDRSTTARRAGRGRIDSQCAWVCASRATERIGGGASSSPARALKLRRVRLEDERRAPGECLFERVEGARADALDVSRLGQLRARTARSDRGCRRGRPPTFGAAGHGAGSRSIRRHESAVRSSQAVTSAAEIRSRSYRNAVAASSSASSEDGSAPSRCGARRAGQPLGQIGARRPTTARAPSPTARRQTR